MVLPAAASVYMVVLPGLNFAGAPELNLLLCVANIYMVLSEFGKGSSADSVIYHVHITEVDGRKLKNIYIVLILKIIVFLVFT